ncbi:hypothetical protein A6A06_22535 [Streptomyces sp. CB02923]|nr:hypothetical protein A6A06_22535 [Streptomyces sp. CB02923]
MQVRKGSGGYAGVRWRSGGAREVYPGFFMLEGEVAVPVWFMGVAVGKSDHRDVVNLAGRTATAP